MKYWATLMLAALCAGCCTCPPLEEMPVTLETSCKEAGGVLEMHQGQEMCIGEAP